MVTHRLHIHQTVDKGIQDIMDKERKKWRIIIRIIISGVVGRGRVGTAFPHLFCQHYIPDYN